ncbi:MAG: glucose 1-dehydrogenase [Verrucomicrobia bacterium]|nr:glucose 1-dehydrogenase [Verrucomicrobiota bacterium]MCH8512613.1 glucose 1-dehydrogenase [Kiritimatiellia bacterium]
MNPPGTNPYLFTGKVVLITGGTSGIGQATVSAFARAGALVSYLGRRTELGEEQAKSLRGDGLRVEFVSGDVTREEDLKRFVGQAVERHGRVDFAINNAGLEADPHWMVETKLADFQRVMEVNVTGTFLSMKHEIPAIRASGGGAIVNTASVLGQVGMAQLAPFVAAKHAVIGLTKTAALEQSHHNIRVNAVAPGAVDTGMLWRTVHESQENFKKISARHPMGRVATADEVANAALWLCSEGSSFVTGHVLNVDGGYIAQ